MSEKYRLMTPGPVQVPKEVLKALSLPMLHHRTPEFEKILANTLSKLKTVFKTQEPVLILSSTGSGGMEAALINTLSPGDKVIALVSGKFGERWAQMAELFAMKVIAHDIPWGESVKVSDVESLIKKHPDTKAVLTQACETSTAVVHPIRELASIVKKYPDCLLLVDAITAIGVMDLPMDEWDLDVVVAGSQKAFMLPTGLSMIAFSKKAWARVEKSSSPRFYFDVRPERKANQSGQTFFSSSVSLIRALDAALDLMLEDGLENFIARFKKYAHALRAAGETLGLKVYAKSPSPSVTAFQVPESLNSEKLRAHMEAKYNVTVMGGQDQLKGKILRIGTLGHVQPDDLEATISALGKTLNDSGFTADTAKALEVLKRELK